MKLPALPAGARNRAWIYYLVAGSGLTALYLFAPHLAGTRGSRDKWWLRRKGLLTK